MTVEQLSERLKLMPPDAQVTVELWLSKREYSYPLTDVARSERTGVILIAEPEL